MKSKADPSALYCSPAREAVFEKDHTCFTREELVKMALAWNDTHASSKISSIPRKSKKALLGALNEKLTPVCGDDQQWCWADKLKMSSAGEEALRPLMPAEWKKNPYAWLSNFDIEKVMQQYEENKSFKYKLMGVYPMDFAKVYSEVQTTNIEHLRSDGVDYLGYIINLDNHNESGSHWVSLFLCVNPDFPSYGAYFYDSVGTEPTTEIRDFLKTIINPQCYKLYGKELPFYYNEFQNQHKNTECGVFSMNFQIKLLRKLLEKPSMSIKKILKINADDAKVHILRNILFRPNESNVSTLSGGGRAARAQRSKGIKRKKIPSE